MKFLAALLTLVLTGTLHAQQTLESFINKTVYPATVLLFSQDESGGMKMRCTATAIDRKEDVYTFITAAHCASSDDTEDKKATVEKAFFYVSPDNPGKKEFFKATVIAAGYQHRGDDFLILSVKTDYVFPTVNVGVDSTTLGDPIINVAAPMGLGRQVFNGSIAMPKLDRSVIYEDINWGGTVLLQLPGTNGGSSGSAIICANQQAICALLVGTVGNTTTVAVPVSKFKEFEKAVNAGTYKYYKGSDE